MPGERGAIYRPASITLDSIRRPESKFGEFQLDSRKWQVYRLLAQGLSAAEIGAEMVISKHTVKIYLARIYKVLEVHSAVEAVLAGVQSKLLNLNDITTGYDLSKVYALSPSEKDILNSLVVNYGIHSLNKDIAVKLCITTETVKTHFTNIISKLGVKNRLQAGLVYLAAREKSEQLA